MLSLAFQGAAMAEVQNLQLEVFLNGRPKHLIGAFVRDEHGRMSATRQELGELGLEVGRSEASAEELVVLDDVPDLVYRYDEALQKIEIDAGHERLAVQRLDLRDDRKAEPSTSTSDIGAVLNYGLNASSQLKFGNDALFGTAGTTASLDGRVFSTFGVLSQSAILRGTEAYSDVLRLDTAFEHSDPATMVSYRAGDIVSGGLSWTRPIRMGGAQAQRRFALRPDLVTIPLPSYSGSAAVPSTVDVYVDGLRLASRDVDAGPFEVSNLPIISGNGEASVVVRDASGQTSVASLPFFSSGDLLRPGLIDFSVETGVARRSFGTLSYDYDDEPLGSATLRVGLSETVTLETHAEGGASIQNAGAGLVASLGRLGLASIAAAASHHEGDTGFLADLSLQTDIRGVTVSGFLRGTFGDYNDLASVTASNASDGFDALAESYYRPARRLAGVTVSAPLPDDWGYAGLNFTYLEDAARDRSAIVAGSYSIGLQRNAQFSINAYHDLAGYSGSGLFARYSKPFGEYGTASAVAGHGDGDVYAGLEASKPIALQGESYGWWARAERDGKRPTVSGALAHRSRYAKAEVAVRRLGADPSIDASVDGAISTFGDGVHFSNRIDDSFALVDVGIPGVDVLYENNVVGTTDRSGRAVVPNLRSYERNRIGIDPKNLPVDVDVSAAEQFVVPSERSGVEVEMAVNADARVALIEILDRDGAQIPAGVTGKLEGGEEFVVGYDGLVYLHGLNAQNRLSIDLGDTECQASFDYRQNAGTQVQIKGVRCL